MTIHHLHSVVVSYNRRELTKVAVESYIKTIDVSYTLVVVDNGSSVETIEWLGEHSREYGYDLILLGQNRFPGYATNRGWERMPDKTTLLHRGDNDFEYLPGWFDHVKLQFRNPKIGQVGLRTREEEMGVANNVGGNNVIRRALWDQGLRYDERPWGSDYPPGWTEDSLFSPEVRKMGWIWTRVKKPSIVSLSREDPDDPYYQETWKLRGIKPPAKETHG